MRNEETSYPRERVKILLLENVSQAAADEFTGRGYASVERLTRALGEDELAEAVRGVHILGIRSKTRVTERVFASADKLLAVGCFCIGVNQVDLKSAAEAGVAVFNAPYSNTRSVAEMVVGLCVMLALWALAEEDYEVSESQIRELTELYRGAGSRSDDYTVADLDNSIFQSEKIGRAHV